MIATTATDPPAAATEPKLVVDTSAWIEWFVDSDLGRLVDAALSQPERCIVPTIVQMELAKWALRELPEDQHLRLVQRWPTSDQFDHPQLTWPRQ